MTDALEPKAPSRTPRWVKIVLVLSLAFNLMIVGVAAGGFAGKDRKGGPRGGPDRVSVPGDLAPRAFIAAIPKEDRMELAQTFRDRVRPEDGRRAELRARVQALLVALRSDPFDPEAISVLMREQRATILERQEKGQMVFLEYLTGLSADERSAFADKLEKSIRRSQRP